MYRNYKKDTLIEWEDKGVEHLLGKLVDLLEKS